MHNFNRYSYMDTKNRNIYAGSLDTCWEKVGQENYGYDQNSKNK